MAPRETEPLENVNPEQQDDAQVLDAADMEARDGTDIESEESVRGGKSDPTEIAPDDRADLVETMDGMQRSGIIDNGAFDGERVDDDEEEILGDTGDDDDEDTLIETEAEDEILGVSSDDDPDTARG